MASLWGAKGASSDDTASSGIWFDPSSICQEIDMEQILINLVAGAIGGVGAGKSSSTFDLGTAGNIVSGLVGGGLLGQGATHAFRLGGGTIRKLQCERCCLAGGRRRRRRCHTDRDHRRHEEQSGCVTF